MGARVSPARRERLTGVRFFLKQLDELFGHRASKLGSVRNRHGALVVACHVVTDAYGNEFDRRMRFDLVDDLAEMLLEIASGVDRKR